MAERRMFAKTIVRSDAFIDMPQSAQLLYFHLAMCGDDDGFINRPKSIMREIGSHDDDLKLLFSKKFVIPFESGVVVIKHWKIHNYIAKDRYNETKYKDEKELLQLDENNSYTSCIQPVYTCETQVRLGKVRIGKDKEDKPKQPGAPIGTQKQVLELYSSLYNQIYGKLPSISYGRMGKTIKDLEKISTIDELELMIKWAMKDNKWLYEVGHPCDRVISSDTLNRYRAIAPKIRPVSKQRQYNYKTDCPYCEKHPLPESWEAGDFMCPCGANGKDIAEGVKNLLTTYGC